VRPCAEGTLKDGCAVFKFSSAARHDDDVVMVVAWWMMILIILIMCVDVFGLEFSC
jgi:hypothetical protein